MIEKAKKQRLVLSGLCLLSLAVALVLTFVTFSLINDMNYPPMWFTLGISVVCYYLTVFLAFMALDRNTAVKFLRITDGCDMNNIDDISEKLGWKKKATERFVRKCKKWGIITKD